MRTRSRLDSIFWPFVAAALAVGEWARLSGFARVFGDGLVLLKPTDSHYYVRYALLQLKSFPRFTHFDPWVNFPSGAEIVWPPLHTWWVAAHVAIDPARAEAMAAWVGPITTLLWLPLIASLLRRALGTVAALISVIPLALLPVMVEMGGIGNADHHVHEPFLAIALALLVLQLVRRGRVGDGVALGIALAVSRLLTTITIVFLPCVFASLLVGIWLVERAELAARMRALVAAGLVSVIGFEVSALLFGDVGSLGYVGISSFLAVASAAGFGAAIAVIASRALFQPEPVEGGRALRQWAIAGGVVAVASGSLLISSATRAAQHLAGGDPLMEVVVESQPIWRLPSGYFATLGVWGLVAPLALLGVILTGAGLDRLGLKEVRPGPAKADVTATPSSGPFTPSLSRGALLVFAIWTLLLAAAFALQLRFVQPLCGPLAVMTALGLLPLWRAATPRVRWVGTVLAAIVVLSFIPELMPKHRDATPTDEALARNTLLWVRDHTPATGDYAVLATHDLGHLVTLWAQRPNVSSPFSQAPWHIAANARASAVLAATDDESAYQAALATRARYLVSVPFAVILGRDGSKDDATMARRLLEHAAMGEAGHPATAHFQLVHDSSEERLRAQKGPYARVFEIVPGAVLSGTAAPGTVIRAELVLKTRADTTLSYARETQADARGEFRLRVAYPTTQRDSDVQAIGAYQIHLGDDSHMLSVSVPERAVREGTEVRITGALAAQPH